MPLLENEPFDGIDDTIPPFHYSFCRACKHFNGADKGTCSAYPDGIPEKFSEKFGRHDDIEPDQKGDFVWKSKKD